MSIDTNTKPDSWPARAGRYARTYNFLGLAMAVTFFCFSLLPSLLPRSWFFQGLVTGIAAAIGYGLGTFLSFGIRWLFEKDLFVSAKRTAWRLLYALGPALIIVFLILGAMWQNQLRALLDMQPPERSHIALVFALALVVGIGCIRLGRSVRRLYRWIFSRTGRFIPRRIGMALSFGLAGAFVIWVVSGAFVNFLGAVSSLLYDHRNRTTPDGVSRPTEATRSGGPGSAVPWDTIGYQGQGFVAKGPSQAQLEAYTNRPADQQIRIYVGVNSAADPYDRAQLAVKEIRRTGAMQRQVLAIAIPTGTGWLNAQSVDALEYMFAGDTAIVSQQYSYLPSWISFIVDKQKARDAGKALYDAVYAEWSAQPQDRRPRLLMYGLSLGAFGGQAAFSGPGDMLGSVDGALWQGTPGDTELWKDITSRRDPGSPEWQPVIENGKEIRFASQTGDITAEKPAWGERRALYMQHGSDPIVWFNFDLPLHKPDWLAEQRAPDVMANTAWVPFVTFFQLAADQVVGMGVPKRSGHNYETTVADAWAAIAEPDGWDRSKAEKLQAIINTY